MAGAIPDRAGRNHLGLLPRPVVPRSRHESNTFIRAQQRCRVPRRLFLLCPATRRPRGGDREGRVAPGRGHRADGGVHPAVWGGAAEQGGEGPREAARPRGADGPPAGAGPPRAEPQPRAEERAPRPADRPAAHRPGCPHRGRRAEWRREDHVGAHARRRPHRARRLRSIRADRARGFPRAGAAGARRRRHCARRDEGGERNE